jgi:hypothetical protein
MEGRIGYLLANKAARDWSPLISQDFTLRIISVTCDHCGFMRLFSTDVLGL